METKKRKYERLQQEIVEFEVKTCLLAGSNEGEMPDDQTGEDF